MERERIRLGDSVSLYVEGRCWMIDMSTRGGSRMRRSLATSDRWDAIERAARIAHHFKKFTGPQENVIPLHIVGPGVFRENPPPGAILAHAATTLKSTTVEDAIRGYDEYQTAAKGNTRQHARNVKKQLERFVKFAQAKTPQDVTPADVMRYLAHCTAEGNVPKTRKDKLGILGGFFGWCCTMKYVSEDPTESVAAPRVPRRDVRYISTTEVHRLLEACKRHPLGPLVRVALYTGLRRSELLKLKWVEIDLPGRAIRVHSAKTGRSRTVPIFDQILPTFAALKRGERVFARSASGHLCRKMREVFAAARIPDGGLQILRHSFVSHLLLAGVDAYRVARWAGHDIHVQQQRYAATPGLSDRPINMSWFGSEVPKSGILEIPQRMGEQEK